MGSKSKSSTATTSNFYDNRQVNDAGGGIVGSGNFQDQSINLTDNTRTDSSIRYTDSSSQDSSIRYADSSSTNTNNSRTNNSQTTITTTDGGSVEQAVRLATTATTGAFKNSGDALGFGRDVLADVVGLAKTVVGQAGSQAEAASSIAAGAYAGAADTSSGNKTLVYAGIAAVALVGAAVAFGIFRK